MKKLAMFLGCGVVAFAIGCSEAPPAVTPTAPAMDPQMMQQMQKGAAEVKPGDAVADPAALTAPTDPAAPADDKPKEDEPKKDAPKEDAAKEDKPKEDK